MFTKAHECAVVKFDDSLATTPEFGRDYIARGQHLKAHLHVVTGERNSNEVDEGGDYESVPPPHGEHDSIHFTFSNKEGSTS